MGAITRWFIANPIAGNLLMVFLVALGISGVFRIDKDFFPSIKVNQVSVALSYPGASPREVEEQICVRIEEAIHTLDGIKEIRSSASQGVGQVFVEALPGYELQRLTAEIKNKVDAIDTFPVDAEKPVVTELAFRVPMVTVTVSGELNEKSLKEISEALRDDLAEQPWVTIVELSKPRPYEVSVEVSEYDLRRYGMSFNELVEAIRKASLNLPAGSIKTAEGAIRLQTRGQAYVQEDFEDIVIRTQRDGTQLKLGEVATVIDGFEDMDIRTRFDRSPSHNLTVFATEHPNVLRTSEAVRSWVAEQRLQLPNGIDLTVWQDRSDSLRARISTLLNNGVGGLLLVFALLLLFLRPRLAMWVSVGIGVAFFGALGLLQFTGVSLNMMSLFAFLLILGIVVDDAIIVGESVHAHQSTGESAHSGATNGTLGVLKPVMFAVISTMVFFAPMLAMPGTIAQFAFPIPVVVLIALTFSLVECLWILPAHLAHMPPLKESSYAPMRAIERVRRRFADGMVYVADSVYRPLLERAIHSAPVAAASFFAFLLITLGLFGGGWVKVAFFPEIQADYMRARVTLPEGGPFADTLRVLEKIETAAEQLKVEYTEGDRESNAVGHIYSRGDANVATVTLEARSNTVEGKELAQRWEALIGPLPSAKSFQIDFTTNDRGKPISLILAANDTKTLETVTAELREELGRFTGVYNITDTLETARDEVVLSLQPAAENLGLSLADLARQVREGFYGGEVQRIPRQREDVKVMVRYPDSERLSVDDLSNLRIRTGDGSEVPFNTVATVTFEPGFPTISRLDRKRTVEVSADIVDGGPSANEIVSALRKVQVPTWEAAHPGLLLDLDGEMKEAADFAVYLAKALLASMAIIYGLMAIAFRSYWQPLLVLTAVPFGMMGAILGHLFLGLNVTMVSFLGVIACSGVVVNDNLVLIDRINQLKDRGYSLRDALLTGGVDRFRPIILTSLTTFVGLLPIMSETSTQAQFLIPMVVSLAFGVLFATAVTLVLVPVLYELGCELGGKSRSGTLTNSDPSDTDGGLSSTA
ncbi:MAG: efflux RND transporter permease subunit [Pseudomonadota bacterium]